MVSYFDVARRAYDLELDEQEWVDQLTRGWSALSGMPVLGYVIQPNAVNERIRSVTKGPHPLDGLKENALELHQQMPTALMRSLYGDGPFVNLWSERSTAVGEKSADFVDLATRTMEVEQVEDMLGLYGGTADGGLMMCKRTLGRPLAPRARWALRRLAAHIAAGFRLRSAVSAPVDDAVVDERGAILEGTTSVKEHAQDIAEAASEHTRAVEMAASAPEGALSVWRGLVAGHWSLVRGETQGSRRVLLLRRNELVAQQNPDDRSRRAASVAELVARGHTNKFVAYELGLSESTVASDLALTLKNLGMSRREELVRLGPFPSQRDEEELPMRNAANKKKRGRAPRRINASVESPITASQVTITSAPEFPVPAGLEVRFVQVGAEVLAELSFDLDTPAAPPGVTDAERAVCDAILRGESNASIAAHRSTSTRTVANQVACIFKKLGVHSRSELIARLSTPPSAQNRTPG